MLALVKHNRKGFTLVEVMVSLIILAVGLVGSLMGIMAAVDYNQNNAIRNGAVKLAQEQQEAIRNMPFASLATIPQGEAGKVIVQRQFRKSLVSYDVIRNLQSTNIGTNNLTLVGITVRWQFKNRSHTYTLETMVRQTK